MALKHIAVRMFRPTQGDLIACKVNELSLGIFAARRYLEQFGIGAERGMFTLRTDDQVAYWELLKAGTGIGFAAAFLAREAVDVVRILPEVNIPPLPMWLTVYQELHTSLRIRRVMDFLSEALQPLVL